MAVLCYHSVCNNWVDPLAVTTKRFEHQCEWLARQFTTVDLETAVGRLDRFGRLPRRVAALTFDDGFADNFDVALPILRRLRLPATVFVVAATIDRGYEVTWVDSPPPFRLETLTRDQIVTMAAEGVAIGSHSLFHKDLTSLSHSECLEDLKTSRQILEEIIRAPVPDLAYPRGRWNHTVADAAKGAGYARAFTLPTGPEEISSYSLPRVGVYRANGSLRFRMKNARWYLPARMSKAYQFARR
jgi:peptidoglycan/xylan/chitin deacetylase (PgdA/CDA1 family)